MPGTFSALNQADYEAVHLLWDKLSNFSSAQIDEAWTCLVDFLVAWMQADDALWFGAVRPVVGVFSQNDPQNGWRARAFRQLHPKAVMQARVTTAIKLQDKEQDPGAPVRVMTSECGRFRAYHLHDGFIDIQEFRQTVHYRVHYETVGVTDRIWVVFPLNESTESYFVFDRLHQRELFTATDIARAAYTLRGLKWLHRQFFLSHGLIVARRSLTPLQREIAQALLTGQAEKEIACSLQRSTFAVHKQIKEIFRRFGVTSRAGFMALWLGS